MKHFRTDAVLTHPGLQDLLEPVAAFIAATDDPEKTRLIVSDELRRRATEIADQAKHFLGGRDGA